MEQRLIDANALRYHMGVNQNDKQIFYITGEDIDAAPTIDPESLRPRSYWISDSLYVDGKRKLLQWCSLCNCPGLRKTKYCPHCGARMKMED